MLSRSLAAEGFYPAVDPLASSSVLLDPLVVGEEHYRVAERARETLARFKDLQDIIALLGVEELGAADRLIVRRARRLQRFLSQPFTVTEAFTGTPGRSVRRAETLAGCRAILDGETDEWAESSLYMVGNLDEARREGSAGAKSGAGRMKLRSPRRSRSSSTKTASWRCAPRTPAAASASCRATRISSPACDLGGRLEERRRNAALLRGAPRRPLRHRRAR